MKFLCVNCDEQMSLVETCVSDPSGSLSVRFGCPNCSFQVCMLTNAAETQVVRSLGVRVGGEEASPASGSDSRRPLSGVVGQLDSGEAEPSDLDWTAEARSRLQNIPEFVRPMAKQGVEHFARARGYRLVDEEVLEQARQEFGM